MPRPSPGGLVCPGTARAFCVLKPAMNLAPWVITVFLLAYAAHVPMRPPNQPKD
jgi:hypothetical protein